MSIQVVNGYLCADCKEVSLAKRGIDPHKEADPAVPASEAKKSGTTQDADDQSGVPNAQTVDATTSPYDLRAKLDYASVLDTLA